MVILIVILRFSFGCLYCIRWIMVSNGRNESLLFSQPLSHVEVCVQYREMTKSPTKLVKFKRQIQLTTIILIGGVTEGRRLSLVRRAFFIQKKKNCNRWKSVQFILTRFLFSWWIILIQYLLWWSRIAIRIAEFLWWIIGYSIWMKSILNMHMFVLFTWKEIHKTIAWIC